MQRARVTKIAKVEGCTYYLLEYDLIDELLEYILSMNLVIPWFIIVIFLVQPTQNSLEVSYVPER